MTELDATTGVVEPPSSVAPSVPTLPDAAPPVPAVPPAHTPAPAAVPVAPQTSPGPAAPGRSGPSIGRRLLRLVGRVVSLAVLVGAGVGGWIAADRFLLGEEQPAPQFGAWPTAYREPAPMWESYRVVVTGQGGDDEVQIDVGADGVRIVEAVGDGAVVELRGGDGVRRAADEGSWAPLLSERVERHLEVHVGPLAAARAPDLVPFDAEPFADVSRAVESVHVDGASDHRVSIDLETFDATSPIAFGAWRSRWNLPAGGLHDATITVDGDGRILRYEREDGTVVTWQQIDGPPSLQGPVASDPDLPGRVWDFQTFDGETPVNGVRLDVVDRVVQQRDASGVVVTEVSDEALFARESPDAGWTRTELTAEARSLAALFAPLHVEDVLVRTSSHVRVLDERATPQGTIVDLEIDVEAWLDERDHAADSVVELLRALGYDGGGLSLLLDGDGIVVEMTFVDGSRATWRPVDEPMVLESPVLGG